MFRALTLTTLLGLPLLLGGCTSNASTICERRQECFNDGLDTGECADAIGNWEDEVEGDARDDRKDRTAECAECVGDRTCAEILGNCIDDCIGIP